MLTEKESAIRKVILKRVAILDKIIATRNITEELREYYKGKRDGLMQAFDLVGDSLACINVEL